MQSSAAAREHELLLQLQLEHAKEQSAAAAREHELRSAAAAREHELQSAAAAREHKLLLQLQKRKVELKHTAMANVQQSSPIQKVGTLSLGGSRGDVFLRLNRLLLKDDSTCELENVNWTREFVIQAQHSLRYAQGWLDSLQKQPPPTSRAGYLSSLRELIGDRPERTWKEEWDGMTKEWLTVHRNKDHWQAAKELEKESLSTKRGEQQYVKEIKQLQEHMGWKEEHAEAWVMLSLRRDVIASALRDRRHDYAASMCAQARSCYLAP